MGRTLNPVKVGEVFSRLTVLAFAELDNFQRKRFLCRCECGKECVVAGYKLRQGATRSCGCLNVESCRSVGSANLRHGMSKSPTYLSWSSMLQRCNNPADPSYCYYGALGVSVDPRWKKFDNFLADMGERPETLTLDRLDPFGNYTKANCRWATAAEQANNKRSSSRSEEAISPRKETE